MTVKRQPPGARLNVNIKREVRDAIEWAMENLDVTVTEAVRRLAVVGVEMLKEEAAGNEISIARDGEAPYHPKFMSR